MSELAYETALTQILSNHKPEIMPRLIAADQRHGWLLMADGGQRLRGVFVNPDSIRLWEDVLPVDAEFQIAMASYVDQMIEAARYDRAEAPQGCSAE